MTSAERSVVEAFGDGDVDGLLRAAALVIARGLQEVSEHDGKDGSVPCAAAQD